MPAPAKNHDSRFPRRCLNGNRGLASVSITLRRKNPSAKNQDRQTFPVITTVWLLGILSNERRGVATESLAAQVELRDHPQKTGRLTRTSVVFGTPSSLPFFRFVQYRQMHEGHWIVSGIGTMRQPQWQWYHRIPEGLKESR